MATAMATASGIYRAVLQCIGIPTVQPLRHPRHPSPSPAAAVPGRVARHEKVRSQRHMPLPISGDQQVFPTNLLFPSTRARCNTPHADPQANVRTPNPRGPWVLTMTPSLRPSLAFWIQYGQQLHARTLPAAEEKKASICNKQHAACPCLQPREAQLALDLPIHVRAC